MSTVVAFTKPANIAQSINCLYTEYVQTDGELVHPGHREVVRVTHDGRFALVKRTGSRGSYQLAVQIGEVADFPGLDAAPLDLPVYRSVNVYLTGKLSDAEQAAGALVGELGSDPFTVELPGELAPRVRQLVALRIAAAHPSRGAGELGRVDTWTEAGTRYSYALRSLVADAGYEAGYHEAVLRRAVEVMAEEAVTGSASYVYAGHSITYSSPEPPLADQVRGAHDEAVEEVLAVRADIAQGTAALRAKRVELENELREALERELRAAHTRATALVELYQLNVNDAAQQLLNGADRLPFGSRRGAYSVAEDMARVDAELKLASNDPRANTVLTSDQQYVGSIALADA